MKLGDRQAHYETRGFAEKDAATVATVLADWLED